jgi:hypothetical protein
MDIPRWVRLSKSPKSPNLGKSAWIPSGQLWMAEHVLSLLYPTPHLLSITIPDSLTAGDEDFLDGHNDVTELIFNPGQMGNAERDMATMIATVSPRGVWQQRLFKSPSVRTPYRLFWKTNFVRYSY